MTKTSEDLVENTNSIFYELQMFMDTTRLIESLGLRDNKSVDLLVIRNSLIESFAVHARVLIEFLFVHKKRFDSDSRAHEYYDDPETWKSEHAEINGLLKETWGRVGQEIAHLTYHRLDKTFETKHWKVREISNEILELFREFICGANDKLLGEQLKNYINQVL